MIRIGQRLRRGTQALAVAVAMAGGMTALASAQPASAAVTTGYLNSAQCSQRLVQGYADPYKVSTVWLPSVTGIASTYQPVWLHVEFMHATTYREYWFRTYARSGVWASSWTWKDGRTYTMAEDVAPESGFATGDAGNLNTYVKVTAYWYSGSTLAGTAAEFATNPTSYVSGPNVCNTGQYWKWS
jgi:hypothetical protein